MRLLDLAFGFGSEVSGGRVVQVASSCQYGGSVSSLGGVGNGGGCGRLAPTLAHSGGGPRVCHGAIGLVEGVGGEGGYRCPSQRGHRLVLGVGNFCMCPLF